MAASTLNTISPFLKEADRLVKSGDLQEALKTIHKALSAAPGNLYVQAYEANVLTLIEKKKLSQKSSAVTADAEEKLHNLAQVTIEDIGRTEQLASTLISTHDEIKQQHDEHEKKMRLSEEKMNARVEQFIQYAKELAKEGKYSNALDEINRAFVIDPLNKKVTELESVIRREYDKEITRQQVEQQRLKHEEKQLLEEFAQTNKANPIAIDQKKADEVELLYKEARQFAQSGKYDNAMTVILNALSIYPAHIGLLELHKRVSNAITEQKNIEKEIERRKFLAQKRILEETNQKINKFLTEAQQHFSEGQFTLALQVLNTIDHIQPQNKAANQLRKEIQEAQLKALDAIQTQTILPEQTVRKKQQDVVTQFSHEHVEVLSSGEMSYRLQKAKAFQNQCRFEDALGEVALILVQNPTYKPALALRDSITEAQRQLQLSLQEQMLQAKETETKQQKKNEILFSLLAKIKTLREKKEFSEALDEIARAILLDPLNEDLTQIEQEIRREDKEYTASKEADTHILAQHQFLETLRNAKDILMKSGYVDSTENLQTEDALRGLGKELKKKLSKKNNAV